jgi:hypothetical protein
MVQNDDQPGHKGWNANRCDWRADKLVSCFATAAAFRHSWHANLEANCCLTDLTLLIRHR